jgi:hypothetical protein
MRRERDSKRENSIHEGNIIQNRGRELYYIKGRDKEREIEGIIYKILYKYYAISD